jgi:hypothetical protein
MRSINTPSDVDAIDARAVVPTAVFAPGTAHGEFVAAVVAAFSAETDGPKLCLAAVSPPNIDYCNIGVKYFATLNGKNFVTDAFS